ncbi:MAG: EamA family transporter [Candidatus Micrarchaeota archaeon]|nr:EamA family transporter [Candidatus Micrarchaeota archaeon]MDE1804236.1 EamA family transporter [Candidatus Micrarchaeota archaeon]MDE1846692.1 EamA family transporter [Candidatus Micrarchaeota archaeon]
MEWYILILLSAFLMTLATIVEKRALKAEHATQYSSAFSWLIAIVSLVLIPFAVFDISGYQWFLLIVGGTLSAITYLVTARVYKHGSLSIATSLSGALPVLFVVLLAYVFLSEYLTAIQYAAIAGIIVATYLVLSSRFHGRKEFDSSKYKYMMIANAFISAISAVIGKYQLLHINIFAYMIITQIIIAIEFAIFISIKYNGIKEIGRTIVDYKFPIVATVLLTMGYRLSYFAALAQISAPVSIATPLRSTIFTVMTVVAGGIMFKERGLLWKIALSIVMVAMALVLTLG